VDFHAVMEMLGEDLDALPPAPNIPTTDLDRLAELEARYLRASPETRARVSKTIERGPIGNLVKRANGYKCQLCEALGRAAIGFMKRNGEPYVEAHHAMPVSRKEIGSLAASNIMTLCPNHHREVHFGCVEVVIGERAFTIMVDGKTVEIARFRMSAGAASATSSEATVGTDKAPGSQALQGA
jgi:hypothetical protein